jgi:hypothetical protein
MIYEVMELLPISLEINALPEPVMPRKYQYNFFRLHPVTRAAVFAYVELTPTDVMERLIDSYCPRKE